MRKTLLSFFLIGSLFVAGSAMAANTLEVSTDRPLTGTYGLKVDYDLGNNNATYLFEFGSANQETSHRTVLRMYLDSAQFQMADNDKHQILRARDEDGGVIGTVYRVHIRRIIQNDPTSKYRIVLWCNLNGGGTAAEEFVGELYLIPDKWQLFHFEWKKESSPGAADGYCGIHKGNPAAARFRTGISAPFDVTSHYFGAFSFVTNNGTQGPLYYDDFEAFRTLTIFP